MRDSKIVTILLVEDDEVDVKALRWAFENLKIANPMLVACDGVEALEMLPSLPRPYLIVTDINMPRMNGIELLRKLRASEEFHEHELHANDRSDRELLESRRVSDLTDPRRTGVA